MGVHYFDGLVRSQAEPGLKVTELARVMLTNGCRAYIRTYSLTVFIVLYKCP